MEAFQTYRHYKFHFLLPRFVSLWKEVFYAVLCAFIRTCHQVNIAVYTRGKQTVPTGPGYKMCQHVNYPMRRTSKCVTILPILRFHDQDMVILRFLWFHRCYDSMIILRFILPILRLFSDPRDSTVILRSCGFYPVKSTLLIDIIMRFFLVLKVLILNSTVNIINFSF